MQKLFFSPQSHLFFSVVAIAPSIGHDMARTRFNGPDIEATLDTDTKAYGPPNIPFAENGIQLEKIEGLVPLHSRIKKGRSKLYKRNRKEVERLSMLLA
ncbi:hypothetical protein [Flagellimonas eckloniae]|uniref:hypothetical protein n=1 Tax=Flagellimonas eckloniae TaxID=346185 RepID=UPI001112C615|nr:hypothetical protein [Allomuricauda eckloniae]